MRIFPFLLIHIATVKPLLGNSAYGPVWDDPITQKCRVEPYHQLVRDKEGTEIVARYRIFFDVPITISAGSQVIYQGKEYEVISVAEQNGLHLSHYEVYIK